MSDKNLTENKFASETLESNDLGTEKLETVEVEVENVMENTTLDNTNDVVEETDVKAVKAEKAEKEEHHHHKHHMSPELKHSFKMVAMWMGIALLVNIGVLIFMGPESAVQFLGGYLIELSLSVDNLFVFITIFMSFGVPEHAQHKVLAYGIMGAVVLRLIFIAAGVSIVNQFEWVLYIFGFILILSGIKMFRNKEEKAKDPHDNMAVKLLKKVMPITDDFEGERFFVRKNGIRYATPLLAVVVVIEFSDILFAIDSVPAVFSISTNLFIVYVSNILAILGLRQLYFVLEHLQERFQYVKYGVATILTFTGLKLAGLMFHIHIPNMVSIIVILSILTISIVASMIVTKKQAEKAGHIAE